MSKPECGTNFNLASTQKPHSQDGERITIPTETCEEMKRLLGALNSVRILDGLRADSPTDEEFRRAKKVLKQNFADALNDFLGTLNEEQARQLALQIEKFP